MENSWLAIKAEAEKEHFFKNAAQLIRIEAGVDCSSETEFC